MKMSGDKMLASSPMLMFLLSLLMASFFHTTAGQVGVCFGQKGNNLPNPREVVAMYKLNNITRMRMYENNTEALNALRGSGIEFILDVPNHFLKLFADSQTEANAWVQNYVKNYHNDIRFRYISVGNEVKPGDQGTALFQAMQNIDKALSDAGLSNIKVSTTTYMGAFTETFPPSHGRFKDEFLNFLQPAIHFLAGKGSPLLVNIYTYFSYKDSKNDDIPLAYALFTETNPRVLDNPHTYQNLFDANIDSVYAALEKSGGGSLDVVVSESGWPTQGGKETSKENAKTYVNNLIQHVKNGSPRRPGKPIETYIFAMFDENDKPEETPVERYWGLFSPDKVRKYDVTFN
ncbi:unnamed protein product [Eruca vesicaria subsp. sativa]|uniref:glucan endo-1,3-beta-D-glucosidase n=1 Tax=Eruca vesicaria subsp. sativa TaxID=29727 RepID=A0ABC8LKK9_ERUVS|nr:unnamed protein product [Eruca vesicaria subsp. sativa]